MKQLTLILTTTLFLCACGGESGAPSPESDTDIVTTDQAPDTSVGDDTSDEKPDDQQPEQPDLTQQLDELLSDEQSMSETLTSLENEVAALAQLTSDLSSAISQQQTAPLGLDASAETDLDQQVTVASSQQQALFQTVNSLNTQLQTVEQIESELLAYEDKIKRPEEFINVRQRLEAFKTRLEATQQNIEHNAAVLNEQTLALLELKEAHAELLEYTQEVGTQLNALLARKEQLVLTTGAKGEKGDTGAPGIEGLVGPTGDGFDDALVADLISRIRESDYYQQTQTPDEYYDTFTATLSHDKDRLQNAIDALDELEIQ